MEKQVYFEDVEVGYELAPLEKTPTTRQLVKYAGISCDDAEIHFDKDVAVASKLPGVIVHGSLKNAFLGQLMTDFAGGQGWLKELSVQYREIDVPGVKVTARGRVTAKRVEGSDHIVECETWLENATGEKTTLGTAIVILPSLTGFGRHAKT